jgi:hypothetical protein
MGVMNNGMGIMGINIDWQQVIKGLVLLGAVAFDLYNKKRLDAGRSLDGIARCLRAITCTWDRLLLSEDERAKAFANRQRWRLATNTSTSSSWGGARSEATQRRPGLCLSGCGVRVGSRMGIDIRRTIFFAIFIHPL